MIIYKSMETKFFFLLTASDSEAATQEFPPLHEL